MHNSPQQQRNTGVCAGINALHNFSAEAERALFAKIKRHLIG